MNETFFDVAEKLADMAGEISKNYFRQNIAMSFKYTQSIVTEADLAIEKTLRDYLKKSYPSHDVLGEEYGFEENFSDYIWVIDPIDGTVSFACGKPTFCTLIALLYKNEPIIGVIDQPILQERWSVTPDRTTLFNSQICNNSDEPIEWIRLNCTTPLMFNRVQQEKFQQLQKNVAVSSYGGDGYAYGLMASGFIDAIVEADLNFYDVASLIPIIRNAGGQITDWCGEKICLKTFDGTVLATRNHSLHARLLEFLK